MLIIHTLITKVKIRYQICIFFIETYSDNHFSQSQIQDCMSIIIFNHNMNRGPTDAPNINCDLKIGN